MLERMVILPEYQGKSIGTRSLRAIPEEELSQGLDVHLQTNEERNVRFYERLGWEVIHDQDYCQDDPDYSFHSWHMVRKAQS